MILLTPVKAKDKVQGKRILHLVLLRKDRVDNFLMGFLRRAKDEYPL